MISPHDWDGHLLFITVFRGTSPIVFLVSETTQLEFVEILLNRYQDSMPRFEIQVVTEDVFSLLRDRLNDLGHITFIIEGGEVL